MTCASLLPRRQMLHTLGAAALASLACLSSPLAQAETGWPSKPVTIVVPFRRVAAPMRLRGRCRRC